MQTNTLVRRRVHYAQEVPVVATLRLRMDQLDKIRRWNKVGSDLDLATRMAIDPGTLSRVLRGARQPGPKFIASLCLALDASLDDLFEIVPGDDGSEAVA